ncbi:lipopolysaccharide heptosyltransferase II [Thermodesulfobacteriota bacterium]
MTAVKPEIKKILIRATNWVGDVVMTLPALEAVNNCYPGSHISILAKSWVAPLFEGHPAVNDIIVLENSEGKISGLKEVFRISRKLKQMNFDMAILFQNAFEAALIAFLSGIKQRVGFSTDHRDLLLTDPVSMKFNLKTNHQVGYYLDILRHLGCSCEISDPTLYVSKDSKSKAGVLLKKMGIKKEDTVLGLSPGAIFGPAKRWPPDRFASIGDRACEEWNARVIIMGSSREKEICNRVSEKMKHESVNLCGATGLSEALGVIEQCDLFLTNDSGLMHVAGALKVPLVAIFGSTNPRATGPKGSSSKVIWHEVECSPCLKQKCPIDFHCMMDINPDEVWTALNEIKNIDKEETK